VRQARQRERIVFRPQRTAKPAALTEKNAA
jgi:hypothetical protein